MRKLFYLLIVILGMLACGEDALEPTLTYENLYTIQDDPSDPVKHRIYEIYKEYDLPVYFKDTIGKYFVKYDINGEPFYRYETVDMRWLYYSMLTSTSYRYVYQTDADRQMKSLDFVETLLGKLSKPLQPYFIFVTDQLYTTDSDGTYLSFAARQYRTVVLGGLADMTVNRQDSLADWLRNKLIISKISNYSNELLRFHTISKTEWYDLEIREELGDLLQPVGLLFLDDYWKNLYIEKFGWTEERVENHRDKLRPIIGSFGFVAGSTSRPTGFTTPYDQQADLNSFIEEVVSCSKEEFTRRWGSSPLVMKKYEILRELLEEKFDFKL